LRKFKLLRKISRALYILKKKFLHLFKPYTQPKKILFIVGCQRSGTGLMLQIFDNDLNTKTFGEFSKLSNIDEDKIRLNPLPLVEKDLQKVRVPLIILKPLVETQNILKLLEYFDDCKALWMYRDYKDVVSSNLHVFGINRGSNDLLPIVENDSKNWRSEKVSTDVREVILTHFSEDMNPHDAAVLFWYARNSIYFELGLDQNPDVLLCKYEDLVRYPEKVVKSIYGTLNQNYPGPDILKKISSKSLKKGQDVKLSPEIDLLAKELLDKLNKTYQKKKPYLSK
jgi:sulfotransferase family protein